VADENAQVNITVVTEKMAQTLKGISLAFVPITEAADQLGENLAKAASALKMPPLPFPLPLEHVSPYKGPDPHIEHVHVSLSQLQQYDVLGKAQPVIKTFGYTQQVQAQLDEQLILDQIVQPLKPSLDAASIGFELKNVSPDLVKTLYGFDGTADGPIGTVQMTEDEHGVTWTMQPQAKQGGKTTAYEAVKKAMEHFTVNKGGITFGTTTPDAKLPDPDDLLDDTAPPVLMLLPSQRFWCTAHDEHVMDPKHPKHLAGDPVECDSGGWYRPSLPHEDKAILRVLNPSG